jgi:hypothetical protein
MHNRARPGWAPYLVASICVSSGQLTNRKIHNSPGERSAFFSQAGPSPNDQLHDIK